MFQVDASTVYRMNPLAALSIDQNSLVGENLCLPGGIFYPGILPLSVQKPQEPGTAVRLGYDLLYKPDGPLLEGQKTANGCVELYKSPDPGLQKPLLIPVSEGDGMGLNSHIVPVDKQSELGLNSTGKFVRVPWMSPYGDASMYPFLDMAYKASFLSQSSPFIQQQLLYQSLCATGSPTAGNERLLFVPPYNLANIASSLGPQIRMSTANPAPAVLSPLSCSQDKALQGLGPWLHQDPSAFSSSTQIHQKPQAVNHTERHVGSRGEKTCQTSSTKNTLNGGVHVNSTSVSQTACSVPPLQSLSSVPIDLQKPLYKSATSASPSVSHPFYMNSQQSSSMHSSSNKTKDASSDSPNLEASSNMLPDRTLPQKATKNTREKTDSAKKLKEYSSKVEALTKLGYLPSSDRKLLLNQDKHLKEGPSPSFNLSTKTSNNDTICTAPSTGLTLGLITSDYNICSQTATRNKVDGTHHQQKPQGSPGSATGQSTNSGSHTSRGQLSANLQKSKVERPRVLPAEYEKGSSKEGVSSGKLGITLSKPRAPERQSSSPESQTESTSRQIYGDSYIAPGLDYSSHYIPYSVAQNMSAQQMLIPSKDPLYPHPLLLGRNSFYPSHITPKHGLLYGGHPYQSSDKMAVPSVSASANLKSKEQLEGRSMNQEPFRSQANPDVNRSHSDRDNSLNQTLNDPDKNLPVVRDDIICIDLVRDEEDKDFSNNNLTSEALQGTSGDDHNQNKGPLLLKPLWLSQSAEQTLSLHATNYNSTSLSPTSQEVSEDPLSPLPNIPEEQTMQCARTSPWYFTRNHRTRTSGDLTCGGNGATVEIKTNASDNEHNQSHQSPSKNGNPLVPVGHKSRYSDVNNNIGLKYTVTSPKSSFYEASPPTENPVHSSKSVPCKDFSPQLLSCRSFNSKVPVGGDMNSRPPLLCPNTEPRNPACTSPNINADGLCCRNIHLKMSTCEPGFFNCSTCGNENLEGPCSTNNSLQITNGGNSNAVWTDANLRGPAFGKGNFSSPTSKDALSKSYLSCGNGNLGVHTNENSFTLGPTCQNFSPTNQGVNKARGNRIPEINSDDETILANTSCGKEQTDSNIQDDQHEEPGCSKNQHSGLKKSITNLSGYVGDSFKYGTSEICTEVSELGQDQRALQVRLFFIVLFLH